MTDIKSYIKKEDLPGDLIGNIDAITINVGSKFLAGEVSNVFAREKQIASDAVTAFNTVTDPNLIKKLSTQLIEHAVTVTTKELTAYVIDKTEDLLSISKITDGITYWTAYWTKEHIKSPKEIAALIQTKSVADTAKDLQESTKKEQIENLKNNISEGIGKINEFRDNTLNSLEAGIGTITSYITLGSKWVITQTNSYVSLAIGKAESFIGEKAEMLEDTRDKALSSVGNIIGSMAADIVNRQAERVAKKAKTKAEELISTVQTKALNAITKAIMIVRQLTGIAIPPVYPKLQKLTSLLK